MHIPVLTKEVITYLDPKPNHIYVDATIGGGGHAEEILKYIGPKGLLIGIDWNEDAIMKLKEKFQKEVRRGRIKLVCDNFARVKDILDAEGVASVAGMLFDFGLSRDLLEESGRGFSFRNDEPLYMTFHRGGAETGLTAEKVINTFSDEELANIFRMYGEERRAKHIASAIVRARAARPIRTSRELADIISRAAPPRRHFRRLPVQGLRPFRVERHPATRAFQAIRIVVNNELENISKGLAASLDAVDDGGSVVVISYHSLEDRIVKGAFRRVVEQKGALLLTKKPVTPTAEEVRRNPSSRSAKLRAVKRLKA